MGEKIDGVDDDVWYMGGSTSIGVEHMTERRLVEL